LHNLGQRALHATVAVKILDQVFAELANGRLAVEEPELLEEVIVQ
jgi:hypothetical protein